MSVIEKIEELEEEIRELTGLMKKLRSQRAEKKKELKKLQADFKFLSYDPCQKFIPKVIRRKDTTQDVNGGQ